MKICFREFNVIVLLLLGVSAFGQNKPSVSKNVNGNDFPADIECIPHPVYLHRGDGKPGREVVISFKGERLFGQAQLEVKAAGRTEITQLPEETDGRSETRVLLPPDVGVKQETQITIILRQGKRELKKNIQIPAMRYWTVYLYPHSHVDIGYTNTLANVELIHKRNIEEGIKLGEKTKNYPEGARYRWNPEITWPLERYLLTATPEQKEKVINAIKDSILCIDASYLNLNTSSCSGEELFQVLRFGRETQKLTGIPVSTFQQMDIPGISWGLVPVLAQQGIRYIMIWPNSIRAGNGRSMDEKPFWWVGPDGKSKVLFFQPGGYANSGSMEKGGTTGRPWFGQRDPDKIPSIIKTGSANVNFLKALSERERPDYPYSYYVVSWCLWDNCPLDADIPDAVKSWNEEFAYPHLVIAGGTEIMKMIEKNYGGKIPTLKGDFTEYWTDGLGTAAQLTAMNRSAKEHLLQAETLWTLLHHGKAAPRSKFDEAWRNIALSSEHTWCAENPSEPFFQDAIWKAKQHHFHEAEDLTQTLLEEAVAPATDRSSGALGPEEGPSEGGISVINTQSWKHSGLITLSKAESSRGDRVTDSEGKDVFSQRLSTGELVFLASDVPALGSSHYKVIAGKCPLIDGCRFEGTTLINSFLKVRVDPVSGNITQFVNLATGRDFAEINTNGGINFFRWMPGDSDKPHADSGIVISTVESGPLVVELRINSKAKGCRSVIRTVRLIQGLPWVEISDIVDKLPLTAKDGIHFGFGFNIPKATTRYDIPWGIVQVEKDQLTAANRNWLTIQRWVDISNEKEGVTWCSPDAPLIESGDITANQTGTWSGERKPWIRKLEPSSTIYSWVMNNHWFTNFPLTQEGLVSFRYRILTHGVYDAADANRFGLEQAQPLISFAAKENAISRQMVVLDGSPAITVSILKSTIEGNTAIIRLRSVSDKDETVKLSWPAGDPKSVNICETEEIPGGKTDNNLIVPAMGMLTLKASW